MRILLVAEMLALLLAVRLATDLNWKNVIFESDYKILCSNISDNLSSPVCLFSKTFEILIFKWKPLRAIVWPKIKEEEILKNSDLDTSNPLCWL